MSLPHHLVIFAKAPRFGTVKTRLARDIGKIKALRFARGNLVRLVRRVGHDPRWQTWLAVTPDEAAWNDGFWPAGLPRLRQRAGDLGERMQRVMDLMPQGPVVIVGSDIPAIRAHHIADAFRTLGAHDAVFGPTPDGGYWLVGLKRRPTVPRIFQNVRWSTEDALADTIANVQGRHALVEQLRDIDRGADLC